MEESVDAIGGGSCRALRFIIIFFLHFFVKWVTVFNISERAAESLLKNIHGLLKYARENIPLFPDTAKDFPQTMHTVYKRLGLSGNNCQIYIVCPRCHCMYDEMAAKNKLYCDNVKYPNHPHANKRLRCGANLGKTVCFNHKEKMFYPFKKFCTQSIVLKVQEYFNRPGFVENCARWKARQSFSTTGHYRDIYDGKIWRDFQIVDDIPFLAGEHNLGLMLNLDWFQPFKHTQYSVGVVYLSILNLPRELRFKTENIILAGVIPGPTEPDSDGLSFYMRPIVNELIEMWKGVEVTMNDSKITVKAAVLCIAADIPAARKLCGFLGHAAKLGCSKCTKEFKTGK